VLLWDLTGCYGRPPSARPFTRAEQEALWQDLAAEDAAVAFGAMRQLMARPAPAAVLLAERLRPAAPVEEKAVRQLLRDLDADDFTAREKAAAELTKIADQAEPLLRQAAEGASPEGKRRIERLLEGIEDLPPEQVRPVRAVEVLEGVGTAPARQLLAEVARGAPPARLTREARAALARLNGTAAVPRQP
jgi:hypothetical protein